MPSPKDPIKRELWIKRISESKKGKISFIQTPESQEFNLMGYHVIRIRDIDIVKDANECAKNIISLIKQLQMVIKF